MSDERNESNESNEQMATVTASQLAKASIELGDKLIDAQNEWCIARHVNAPSAVNSVTAMARIVALKRMLSAAIGTLTDLHQHAAVAWALELAESMPPMVRASVSEYQETHPIAKARA
jgi:hypothetical protein